MDIGTDFQYQHLFNPQVLFNSGYNAMPTFLVAALLSYTYEWCICIFRDFLTHTGQCLRYCLAIACPLLRVSIKIVLPVLQWLIQKLWSGGD